MVDLGLARLSNDLIFAAVILYALAMLGYAAEYAFGRRTGSLANPAPSAEFLAKGGRAARRAAQRAEFGDTKAGALGRVAVAITGLGWVVHVGAVVTRGLAAHRVPWGNMYEFALAITLVAVTVYLGMLGRTGVRYLGAFVMAPVVLYLGVAGTTLYTDAAPLVPALNSYWLKIHTTAAIGSSGILIVAAVVTVLYLLKDRYEHRVGAASIGPGAAAVMEFAPRGGIMRQLPSAATLDRAAYRLIAFAFPLWTFAVIAGAVWAEAAWGRYWGWDPKETWSFITWVVYAGYLHARATAGWKGRKAAVVALVGFGCLTVDFICVNLWITGLHSYAGV